MNTCVHELLHAFLGDIFVRGVEWSRRERHEFRVNWLATRLWLPGGGSDGRESARGYLVRLRAGLPRT